jgi:hypothetical protein
MAVVTHFAAPIDLVACLVGRSFLLRGNDASAEGVDIGFPPIEVVVSR